MYLPCLQLRGISIPSSLVAGQLRTRTMVRSAASSCLCPPGPREGGHCGTCMDWGASAVLLTYHACLYVLGTGAASTNTSVRPVYPVLYFSVHPGSCPMPDPRAQDFLFDRKGWRRCHLIMRELFTLGIQVSIYDDPAATQPLKPVGRSLVYLLACILCSTDST